MVGVAGLFRFDSISTREVRSSGSAEAVANRLSAALDESRAKAGARLEVIGHSIVQDRLRQIPACLRSDYAKAPDKLGLGPPLDRQIFMQAATHGGRHARYRFPDGDLVVLDRDVLIRSALFLFFSISARSNPNALLAQTFTLAHSALCPRQCLPLQYFVVHDILASPATRPVFLKCLNTVLDFVALHEVGHAYADNAEADRRFFHFAKGAEPVEDGRFAVEFFRPRDPSRPMAADNLLTEAQLQELFCDAFSFTARTIMDASGDFGSPVFDELSQRLFLLSRLLFLDDMGVMHGEGPAGQINLARLRMANLGIPVMEALQNAPDIYHSHPPAIRRFDALYLQAEWILHKLDASRSPLDPDLHDMAKAMWGSGVRTLQDILIDALRVSDVDSDGPASDFDALLGALDLDFRVPDSLKGLTFAALVPYLRSTERSLAGGGNNVAQAMRRAADAEPLDRLPQSQSRQLVMKLCHTLLDPVGAVRRMA